MAFNLNLGALSSANFGLAPIDTSQSINIGPLSQADLLASASRAASSPVLNLSTPALQGGSSQFVGPPSPLNVGSVGPVSTSTNTINLTPSFVGSSSPSGLSGNVLAGQGSVHQPDIGKTFTSAGKTYEFVTNPITGSGNWKLQSSGQDFVGPPSPVVDTSKQSPITLTAGQDIAPAGVETITIKTPTRQTAFDQFVPATVEQAKVEEKTPFNLGDADVVSQYNTAASTRLGDKGSSFETWQDLPNVDASEALAAQEAGYESPLAYYLSKTESTDPELAGWREQNRETVFGDKTLRNEFGDLFAKPMDQDAVQHIYGQLKDQYELARENGYKYKHEGDIDEILESEAAKLVAGGVTDLYQIGTRKTPQFETFNNVQKIGNDYYIVETDPETGNETKTKIRPEVITDISDGLTKVNVDWDSDTPIREQLYNITVDKGPVTELINKVTGDPLYDASLKGDWRTNPMGYELRNRNGRTILDVEPRKGGYGRIHWNTGVRDQADMAFMQTEDGLPIILPVWKSTKSDLTPVALAIAAFAGPYAMQIGSALGATTAAGQAALGAGVISGGTQLVVNGKIDLSRLAVSMATAGIAQTGGFTGSDIAADAAQLAEQGLSSAQIADTLVASGVNSVTANLAGTFASAGISVEIAPMITAGTQNMGLTALAMGELDADALTKSFLTGASGEASSLAVDKIIGDENLQAIADATGLSKDQAGSIATSALTNGMNAEILDADKSFLDAVTETLVVSGVSTATANKVATALDDTTSSKGRAAIVGATKNIMDVAGTAAWNDMDIGDSLEAMAPTIIGNAIATYVRTPDIAKTDDKDKTADAPVAKTTQLSESEIANQLEENLIFDGRQATSQEQAAIQAKNSGFNTFIYDNKTYTISPDAKPIDLSESRIRQDLDEGLLYDGRDAKSLNDAAQLARKEGLNTFIYGDKTYTIPSQAEVRESANLEISKQTTFGSAFNKARELLGPGQTFDWQGKSYSTATAEERPDLVTVKPGDVTQTDTGAAFHQNIGKKYTPEEMRILEMAVSENAASPDQIDLKNKDDEGATAQYMSNLFFGGAFKDFKAEDLPLIGGLLKTAAKNQGIGLDGLGNQLKDYSTSYSLVTGTPFETSMQRIGDGLIAYGKELGSEEYLKEINQFNNDYIQQASKARPDGLGKSAWDRYTDWWSMARDNPGAAAGSVLYELGQETLPLAAAATVILAAPTAIGVGTAITLGSVTSALLDANEVFGNTGADRYQYGIANGESEDLARTNAIKEAGVNAFATLGTEFLADKSLMGLYAGGLKTSLALGLGATKAITANWGGEYVESLAHTYNTAAQRGIPIDDAFHNNARSIAVLEATIGKNTAASIVSPALVSSVAIGINENGQDITLEDIRSGNETLASVKLDAPVNVTESGDTLTLGGLTAILKQNDAPVDFKLNADTPVFEKADGSVVTYNDLQFQASNNGQSFGEVIQNLSNNQIVIPKELTTVADISGPSNIDIARGDVATEPTIDQSIDRGSDLTLKPENVTDLTSEITQNLESAKTTTIDPATYGPFIESKSEVATEPTIEVDPNTGTETDIKVDPNTGTKTETQVDENTGSEVTVTTKTDPDSNVTTKTETTVNPDTNIATEIKTETDPDSNVTTKTEINVNPDTNTAVEVKTETNLDTNTQTNTVINTDTNIKTEINVDANTVVATEINLDTNIKTDITINVDKIIEDLIDTGVKPEDALKIAVEEVTENAKSTKKDQTGLATTKKAAGIGGIPMFMSTPYEDTDFEHQSLYTKGKVKPFEGVLDEFMRRFESEPDAPDQITTKPESKMDSDYFVYGSQTDIDDVLGQAPPNTIPAFNVPAFGMRTGGLVPPFAGGGPLTMAAGKLRKDYRQGDAVEGPGDGQSDDIPAMLADGEFVLPADVVAALGNGSNKAGADKLYDMMHNIRRQARQGNPKDLPKPAKSPLQYITRR